MKHLILLFALCAAIAGSAAGQSYSVKGTVTDTLNRVQLYQASVTLVRASDSVLETFGRSRPDGTFDLHPSKEGKYVLRVVFPSFADYVEVINVNKSVTDLGTVIMVTKEHLLQEFVLRKQIAAIKIKGDTTEYMADSFKVKENASVEDLLKKLPGIQVDKDGKITAQGETVQKILVDGEEFFADDPKVVTKGLQANAVEKVQVFDKKSDQAEFTGIDDGQKTKTINLELKENKKKGYFGKADAGGGTDGYFQEQLMLNAFKGKRQLSIFGIGSNTDKVGLGWDDNNKFGGGNDNNTIVSDDGSIYTYYSGNNDDDFSGWSGRYTGEGLPKTWTGGIHYADKWNKDADHLSGNYRYADQSVEIGGNTLQQYLLGGDSTRINNEDKNQFKKLDRHAVDATWEWKIDSSNSIKFTASAGTKNSQTVSKYHTIVKKMAGDWDSLESDNHRNITSNAESEYINTSFLFRKKFAKKGRTLSVDVKENYKDAKSHGSLKSVFASTGTIDTLPSTDQRKENSSNTLSFSAKATYTEPLSKKIFLDVSYGNTINNSTSLNYSYDSNSTGEVLNSIYSSNYTYNIQSNSGGAYLKFVYKKVNFSFGSDLTNTAYLQKDLLHGDTSHEYSYTNVFPKANISYKLAKQTSINLFYQGSTEQPTISQIQPLRQNTDPLNLTVGNPNLKQAFNHRISLHFNDYKVLSNRYIWGSINFTTTENAISTEQTLIGPVSSLKYINVDGTYSGSGYMGFSGKIKKWDLGYGLQLNSSLGHSSSIINGKANVNDNNSYSVSPYFNYEKENKYEFSWDPSATYDINKATVSTLSTSYWVFNNEMSGTVQLPKKFEIASSVDIMIRQKTPVFTTNNNVIKWNAHISKKFLKKDQLEIRAAVFDILNQNLGFSRTAQGSVITQNSYNTIRRYGMLSLIWNFSHTPAGAAAETGNVIVK